MQTILQPPTSDPSCPYHEEDHEQHLEDDFCYVNLIVGSKETGYRLERCRWEDLPAAQKQSANINTYYLYSI